MMARPQKTAQLTEGQIEKLAAMGCSDDEIAALCELSETEIKRSFGPQLKNGRANLHLRVRKKQLQRADEGSDTMLIWLGKVYLGQRETVVNVNAEIDVTKLSDDDLDAIITGKSPR